MEQLRYGHPGRSTWRKEITTIRKTAVCALAVTLLAGMGSAMTLEEILAKTVEARGGRDAWKSVKTVRITGTVHMPNGMEAPLVWEWKRPNKLRSEVTIQGMHLVQAFDGTSAWMIVPFGGNPDPQDMPHVGLQSAGEPLPPWYGLRQFRRPPARGHATPHLPDHGHGCHLGIPGPQRAG